MALRPRLRPLLLLPFILLCQQGAANAVPSLAEAVKQADAKYRQAPDVGGKDDTPKIEAGSGEDDDEDDDEDEDDGELDDHGDEDGDGSVYSGLDDADYEDDDEES
jgi:hypothetical protein